MASIIIDLKTLYCYNLNIIQVKNVLYNYANLDNLFMSQHFGLVKMRKYLNTLITETQKSKIKHFVLKL